MDQPSTSITQGQRIPEWLSARASATPRRVALIFGSLRWTFAQLDDAVGRCASALHKAGVRQHDRVAVLLDNGAEFVVLAHAIPRLGAIFVPLNIRLTHEELTWQLRDVGARFLVVTDPDVSLAKRLAVDVLDLMPLRADSVVVLTDHPSPVAGTTTPSLRFIDLAAPHSIVYTSGTTGRPKGAILTYGNFWWSAIGSALNLGIREDDRWLACLPLFHVGGLAILQRSVIYGITAIVHARFDETAVNRAIDEEGVTHVSVVSTMLQRMLDDRDGRPFPPSLRTLLLGGGPAPLPLLLECEQLGAPVVQTYGLTETASQVATLAPEDALTKLGSAGKPLLPMELRIERDGEMAPVGVDGEIVVRGPSVTPGYWGNPEATERAFRDGWFLTGDIGRLDADGYLYVLERRDDLIVSGGENVYPAEVEAALLAHPAIDEAGVTWVPDVRWGHAVVAVVKLRDGMSASQEELVVFCAERLARYKLPRQIVFVEALPRNAAGKLLRRRLRESL